MIATEPKMQTAELKECGSGHPDSLYKRILQASFQYSLAMLAPLAASMITLPLYARQLTPAEYGLLEILDSARNIFAMLVGARFTESLMYFYGRASNQQERNDSAHTVFYGSILMAGATVAAGWLVSPWLTPHLLHTPLGTTYLRLSVVTLGLTLPLEASLAWLRAIDNASGYLRAALFRLFLTVGVTAFCLLSLKLGVLGMLIGPLVATIGVTLWLCPKMIARTPGRFRPELFLKQVKFGFLLSATGLAGFIINFGDRIFLQRYVTLSDIGLYGLAYKFGMVISIAQSAFGAYWGGQVYLILGGSDGLRNFRKIHSYLIITLGFLMVGIVSGSNLAFHLALPVTFRGAAMYVPWIALTYLIRAHGDYYRWALYVEGEPGIDTVVNVIAAAVCVALYALLIPPFGVWGAIFATAGAFTASAIIVQRKVVARRPYRVDWAKTAKVLGIAAFLSGVAAASKWTSTASQAGIFLLVLALYPTLLVLCRCITTEDRNAFTGLIMSTIARFVGKQRAGLGGVSA